MLPSWMLRSRWLLVSLALLMGLAFVPSADTATSSRKKTGRVGRPQPRTARKPARRAVRQPRPYVPPAVVLPPQASARDREIGEAARRGLGTTRGSVVAMDPYTGRVIAIVNPAEGMSAAYQPCSVFKIVVAIAGLTEGVITPETKFDCRGGSCWMWAGHGP